MFRLLNADEIECRVKKITATGCSLLLYKTARVDRAILTETYGELWQNDFKVIDGKMYGGIGIYNKDLGQWLWRWDCGVESNQDKDKGQASDCFKRSGFKWGIGVELYTAPFIWANVDTVYKDGRYKLSNDHIKFIVKEIGYDDKRNINKLKIVDDKGNLVYELGKYIKQKENKTKENLDYSTMNGDLYYEQEPEISDRDFDLIEGLRACSDLTNLEKYYKQYYKQVENKKEFVKVKDEMKGKLYV